MKHTLALCFAEGALEKGLEVIPQAGAGGLSTAWTLAWYSRSVSGSEVLLFHSIHPEGALSAPFPHWRAPTPWGPLRG
jgi:hypothetical protein